MFQANGDNLRLGRGEVYFNRFAAGVGTGERFLGNVTGLTFATSDETVSKYSSVEAASPLLKEVNIRRTVEATLTLDEYTADNLALALSGTVSTPAQTSGTAVTVSITNVVKGRSYPIGAFNISNVVVEVASVAKTLGTDYLLDTTWGLIHILETGTIAAAATVDVEFDRASITSYKKIAGGDANIEGSLRYISANAAGANEMLYVPKLQIIPEGEAGFITQDDFGNLQVKGKLLKQAGQDLYTLTRLTGN